MLVGDERPRADSGSPLARRRSCADVVPLLAGKRLLVTGVLTDQSLAFGIAELAQLAGAELVLTGAGRGIKLTRRVARHLPQPPDVLELDVTVPEHVAAVAEELRARWGAVDGLVHAIAFAPPSCLGGRFLDSPWDDVSVALQTSAFSLKALGAAMLPLFRAAGGGSIVALDFDASRAWPVYDWMGVSKAALESTGRYLARELGPHNVRVNMVAAGPMATVAAKSIPGFASFEAVWRERSPLGWDVRDPSAVAKACVALLSDWFPMTTGEIVHVDGGCHAMGA
jgi:enoyl-[acyl-carrier protein] reductase I